LDTEWNSAGLEADFKRKSLPLLGSGLLVPPPDLGGTPYVHNEFYGLVAKQY
jgi:hypothetical protein